ncbi:hypothetical protein OIU78_012692 [Salix suchowensis]|nr:hypothetical protein OIU78_012692 [Salix suchowensis]
MTLLLGCALVWVLKTTVWKGYRATTWNSNHIRLEIAWECILLSLRVRLLYGMLSLRAEEQAAGRDEGRSEYGVGRSKGGGIYANGQGKPKKGRGASRDTKRTRPSADPDFDYDDDADLML